MKLTWYGHACFMLETAEGSIVFDPYEDGYITNLKLPEITADKVICSHGHGDHSAAELIKLTDKAPVFSITQIPCFHDGVRGLKRGKNLITVVESEGKRIAHMGDIGHMLSATQLETLGHIDVMMIPVGGTYTVDAEEAKRLCGDIKPVTVVPMHYRMGNAGLQNVASVDSFLGLFGEDEVLRLDGNTWDMEEKSAHVVVFEL